MPSNITPNPAGTLTPIKPDGSDVLNAASIAEPLQRLANKNAAQDVTIDGHGEMLLPGMAIISIDGGTYGTNDYYVMSVETNTAAPRVPVLVSANAAGQGNSIHIGGGDNGCHGWWRLAIDAHFDGSVSGFPIVDLIEHFASDPDATGTIVARWSGPVISASGHGKISGEHLVYVSTHVQPRRFSIRQESGGDHVYPATFVANLPARIFVTQLSRELPP